MVRKMASREPSLIRKPSPEIAAAAAPGSDLDLKKKKTYKSTHSIGSRKATEKVVTYSETLPFFPEMVQQLFNDRSMEPKKASPGKTPPAKSSPARAPSAAKASPAKSPKPSPGKQTTPSKSSPAMKSSPAKTPTTKSPSSPKQDGNSSSSPKTPVNSNQPTDGAQSPKCGNGNKNSAAEGSKSAVKRKNASDASPKDSATPVKKPKIELATKHVTNKAAKSGNNDSKISVAEKLKEISAKAENEEPKKKRAAAGSGSGRKAPPAKPKAKPKPPAGKNKTAQPTKAPAKKAPKKKKEEVEIPSLLSFIKPKREASMNANAMMDILFEKPVSPKKKSASKSPSEVSKTPSKDSVPKSAKKKLVFKKDSPKSSKGKKTEAAKSKTAQTPKPKKSAAANKPKSSNKGSKSKDKKNEVANGKVVKRKSKKRMASLNARALIVAERESMQMVLERAARTDRYCVSWIRHTAPTNHSPNRSIRWVDGLVGCGVCYPKKDVAESGAAAGGGGSGGGGGGGGGVTEISAHPPDLPSVPESKLPVSVLPSPPLSVVPHEKDHVSSDDRPSSVVDVVTAHTPHLDSVSHQPSIIDVVSTHSPVKSQVLSRTLGSFGGLYGHSTPCMGPCPGYAYSTHTHTEGYVTTSSYQCFSGIGAVNPMPLVTPTFRPSAFSVPQFNLPYGYYEGGPYYQPAPTPLLQGPMPTKTCMMPHHLSFQVPHGPVRVLIHNPDTPQDHAAFSEHRSPGSGKGDPHHPSDLDIMRKITNDNNNNSNGSLRNNSILAKTTDILNHSSSPQSANPNNNSGKRGSDKNGSDKSSCKADNSRKTSESKKKDSDSRKIEKNGTKNTKNGDGNSKKKSENGKKREGGALASKTKDSKETKPSSSSRPPKKKGEKKKAGEKGDMADTEADSKEEEVIPEHGWVWVGEPETKKVVSVHMDQPPEERVCYKAIRHSTHGDIINVRDCVLLRTGCRNDVPYVAKVGTFWEHPRTNEKMMSLLWYYQPEHTEAGRQPHDMENEVFASRHRDENSVACIDDKCHVLTYEQYCRYQAEMHRIDYNALPRPRIVPDLDWSKPDVDYPQKELPGKDVDPSTIFCCRNVYDFRMKRILKNPS